MGQLVYTNLLLTNTLHFTCSERKIQSTINMSQYITNMIIGPENERNSQNLFFDRFRKTLRNFFMQLTPTRYKFEERDFV